jgi:hypothetical protein
MEIYTNLIIYAWLFPSILVFAHTLYCIFYVLVTNKYSVTPVTIGIVTTLFTNGPFRSSRSPGKYELLIVLIGSIIPAVSLAILTVYITQVTGYFWYLLNRKSC